MDDNEAILFEFKSLPVEIPEQTHDNSVRGLSALELPERFGDTKDGIMRYVRSLLPEDVRSDPEVAEEAAKDLLRRTLQTAESIRVPGPEFFYGIIPNNTTWNAVRILEFTETQVSYATPPDGSDAAHPRPTINDIASYCPNLETLTFRMSTSMILPSSINSSSPTSEHSSERLANDNEKRILDVSSAMQSGNIVSPQLPNDDSTQISRVFEHANIRRLVLNCADAEEPNSSSGYIAPASPYPPYIPFMEAFRNEAKLKRREIDITIDLHPDEGKGFNRRYHDGFTFIEYWDFW